MMKDYLSSGGLIVKMKKIILVILFAFFFINLVSAEQQSLGTFRQNSCIDLLQTCGDCTYVNISSVIGPDSAQIIGEVPMTRVGTVFNHTSCNISGKLGQYKVNYHGDPSGTTTASAYSYEVTPNGTIQTTGQSISSLAFIILILTATVVLGVLAFKFMDSDTLWVLGIFFFIFFFLLMIYDVWLAYEFKQNYTGSSPGAMIPQTLFITFLTILLAGFGGAVVLLVKKWKKLVRLWKKAIRPEPEEDDDYFGAQEMM